MKDSSYHFVNVEETIDQDNSGSENQRENKDGLKLSSLEQDSSFLTENSEDISKPIYYRLDQVVFAESINRGETTEEPGGQEDLGDIKFVDNVIVKTRPGKRNRYFIDVKDDCLVCPMSTCSQTFATKTLLKAHIRKVHCATTKYMCEECGAGFTAPYLLKRHSAVHGDKVQCAICEKWLSRRTDLSVHMRTHGAARQHACASCGKRFLRLASLRRHEKFVHRDGDLACDRCDARFASRTLWTQHRRTHKR